jgi:hypothetical protein
VLLGTSVCEVETLSSHLGAYSTILDLQYQPTKCSIRQVEVPHILERALINLAGRRCIGTTNWTTERISSKCCSWHLLNYAKSILEKILLCFILLNGRLDLALDCLPHIIERRLRCSKLSTVMI